MRLVTRRGGQDRQTHDDVRHHLGTLRRVRPEQAGPEGERRQQERPPQELTRRERRQQERIRREPRHTPEERALIGLEFGTAAAALGGGILLALRPDGAFLHADPAVLRGTPFADWRIPGLLLAAGCGGGYLLAGLLTLRRHRAGRLVSTAAGTALIGLEAWEIACIEYQPLELVFAGVGAAVVVLALRSRPAAGPQDRPGAVLPA